MFAKKKNRVKPPFLDEDDCLKAMGVARGSSGNMRLVGVILVASVFSFMYFMYLFGGGHRDCTSHRCNTNKAEQMSKEIDLVIEEQEEAERERDSRYLPPEDYEQIIPTTIKRFKPHHGTPSPYDEAESLYQTSLGNVVFGIAASSKLWEKRQDYVKMWWRPGEMRGFVWLEKPVSNWSTSVPAMKVSEDTSKFNYTNKKGSRAAIRLSRVVSETFRMGLPDVDWFVMGDDDTVFVPENLIKVLSKYNPRKFYYIGSHSESHTQNIHFSYNMAYGGGGFAISYALAKALEKIQDRCIQRYPYLYGSDDRIQACLAELGVQLTKEPGFHQFDVYGDAFGLLAAHPVTPLVSIHHLDLIDPIFPNSTQVEAVAHLEKSMRLDPGGTLQQSICYDRRRRWSVSLSWGYAVQVYRGIIPPRTLELPVRTFFSWYRTKEDIGFPFNTRAVSKNPCEHAEVFFMKEVGYGEEEGQSVSRYVRDKRARAECKSKEILSPGSLEKITVTKEVASDTWHLAPRRQCCRVVSSTRTSMELSVGDCESDETIL